MHAGLSALVWYGTAMPVKLVNIVDAVAGKIEFENGGRHGQRTALPFIIGPTRTLCVTFHNSYGRFVQWIVYTCSYDMKCSGPVVITVLTIQLSSYMLISVVCTDVI